MEGISTHAPRTGSDSALPYRSGLRKISTHAPRTGSDERLVDIMADVIISTHAPRTGSDPSADAVWRTVVPFQPTLPARGATPATEPCASANIFQPTLPARGATAGEPGLCYRADISTHAPRTGSDPVLPAPCSPRLFISTHAPRTGSDGSGYGELALAALFQPTLPARGATRARAVTLRQVMISTHAPRTGSDKRFAGV